jgi:hypothetical protein
MNIITDITDAAIFATAGAVVGISIFHTIGGAGLAIGGTAYPIGVVAFAGAGVVAGLATHSVKKSIFG